MEEIEKNKVIDEEAHYRFKNYSIRRITDDMAVIEYRKGIGEIYFIPVFRSEIYGMMYDTFDKALIGLISTKTGNKNAEEYIFRMLDTANKED